MKIVHITGQIASGKSTVSNIFKSLGATVYNADLEAKKLVLEDKNLQKSLADVLNFSPIDNMGILKKEKIGKQLFGNPQVYKLYSSLIHKAIFLDFKKKFENKKCTQVVFESFRCPVYSAFKMDYVIGVIADYNLVLRRFLKRNVNNTEKEMQKILIFQPTQANIEETADFLIYNNEKEMLLPKAIEVFQNIFASEVW